MDKILNAQVSDDFNRARNKARFTNIFMVIHSEKKELLSYYDVKDMIKPKSQTYRGMQVVKIDNIIGSEGRYKDFNKAFLPKKEHLRNRWENIDRAHIKDVILPPISLFKIGEVYFVRDGNHRVSVARTQGVYSIDAEVVELTTEIKIEPNMTRSDLKKSVLEYERNMVLKESGLNHILNMEEIFFTAPGRYDEMLRHIYGHKYYINQGNSKEITLEEAALSWYENVYTPIIQIVKNENMLSRFPGRTASDLYIWTIKKWDELKEKYGQAYPLDQAVKDYNDMYGKNIFHQICGFFRKIFKPDQEKK